MELSFQQLNHLLKLAEKAAQNAGAYIAESASKQITVNKKAGGDNLASQVVTEVDLKSQEIILETLDPTLKKYKLAVVTEEEDDDKSRLTEDNFWCIDPMDGTLSFINKSPGYSVSIALVKKDGTPLIGVIFDPLNKVLYSSMKGGGAFRNNVTFQFETELFKNVPLSNVIDSSFYNMSIHPFVESNLKDFCKNNKLKGLKTIGLGGAAINAMWVLENAPACYFKLPKEEAGGGSIWDFAASACIFNEAGGWVSDIFGNKLNLNNASTTFMNLKGILYTTNPQIAKQIIDLNYKIEEC